MGHFDIGVLHNPLTKKINNLEDSESLLVIPDASFKGALLHRFRKKVEDKAFPCHLKSIISFKKLSPSLNLKITLFWF